MARREGSEHHIIFTDATQCAQLATKAIRNCLWLRPRMHQEPHDDIHKALATVPVLDHYTAQRVQRLFHPHPGNYLSTVDNLMFAVDEAIQHPKVRIIERGLGELVIAALEIQKPFLRDGIIE